MSRWGYCVAAAAAGLIVSAAAPGFAQSVGEFYKGKQIALFVGSNPGGGYDAYARLAARHMPKHIPGNPGMAVKNMAGAGSLTMANHVANIAPKDGTAIGAPQNSVPVERLLYLLSPGGKTAMYDAKTLNWLGSASRDVYLLIAWHTAPVKDLADATKTELIVGSAGANTEHSITAHLLNEIFGTKLKVVTGYPSATEIMLAIERGEVQGNSGRSYASMISGWPEWVSSGKVRMLVQMAMKPHPDLATVPFALDLVKSPADKQVLELVFSKYQMSRPFFAPAEVPKDRVQALRAAFDQSLRDPALLEDAKKQRLDIDAVTGAEVEELVTRLYATPEPVLKRARAILGSEP